MSRQISVTLPAHGWRPRQDQMKLWNYLENGGKRAIDVAHRRWGKDEIGLQRASICANDVGHSRAQGRVGNYWHMLPLANQSRKAIWEAINPDTGRRRIDEAFPPEVIEDRRDGDMFIRTKTGSTWQVVGSDNFQGLLGSPPVGLVFSEWALADPYCWAFLSPILEQNGGWALFITTPRGRNHAFRMYQSYLKTSGYFAERLTANDTPVFKESQLVRAKQDLVDIYGEDDGEALFNQEYNCSWDAPLIGSYYAKMITQLELHGRTDLDDDRMPVDYDYPVETAWDLGFSDDTSIWWYQVIGGEVHWLDYEFASGQVPEYYANLIHDRYLIRGWRYFKDDPRTAMHWVPWDARPKTLASGGKSLLEIFWNDHQISMRVAPNLSVRDGIDNVRKVLRISYFHKRCEKGLDCLRNYRREWDDDRKCFKDTPFHDWASHGSDAARIMANAYQQRDRLEPIVTQPEPVIIQPTWDDLIRYNTQMRSRMEDRIR